MKAAVRCESLDLAGLARAEKHGKREDWIGKQRKIRDAKPLVYGGMDLVDLYAAHTEGARQNKAARKPVLHFIVRFPPEVLTDDGPTPYTRTDRAGRERLMVKQAVRFINETHGGQAVFAARLDRDEAGETVVDVFACPRYLKASKAAGRDPVLWTSATRFGEELARTHQDHIRARMKDAKTAKAITSPRAVGIALQESFGQFFERENGVKLAPRKLKESRAKDRIEVEEWRLRQMGQDAAEAEARRAEADEAALRVSAKSAALLTATAALTAEIAAGTLQRTEQGRIRVKDRAAIQGGLPDLAPALNAAADATEARRREERAAEAAKAVRAAEEAKAEAVKAEAARILEEAQNDRTAAAKDRAEIRGLRERVDSLLEKAEAFLRRSDLPDLARKAGSALMRAAGRPVPEPDATTGQGGSRMRRMAGLDAAPLSAPPAQQPGPEARPADRGDDLGL